MYLRPFGLGVCLVLCLGWLFGMYRLQARTRQARHKVDTDLLRVSQPQFQPQTQLPLYPQTGPLFADDINKNFYQTIIKNNLFAPLGTNLHRTPAPGANLTLVGTFLREDPTHSKALVKNTTTGRQHLLSIGEGIGEFYLLSVKPKQVVFYHNGTEVPLHLSQNVLLNAKRR